jgi:hypothetical protein
MKDNYSEFVIKNVPNKGITYIWHIDKVVIYVIIMTCDSFWISVGFVKIMDFQVQFMYDIDESDIQILLPIPLLFPGMAWPIFMIGRLQ